MHFERFIARHFMPRRGADSGFSGPLTTIAVAGIALGVMVMVMAISILQGFRADITSKVVGFGSHITLTSYGSTEVYTEEPLTLDSTTLALLQCHPQVHHLQPYATKGGMVKTDDQIYGILLRGYDLASSSLSPASHPIEPSLQYDTTFFSQALREGRMPKGKYEVLISTTIASRLRLQVGSKMRCYFWQGEGYRPRVLTISGLYNTDLTEMDERYCIGSLEAVRQLCDWDSLQAGGYELSVSDFSRLDATARELLPLLPYDVKLTTVVGSHPALFSWLDLLGANITLLLVIMALVSAVCIVSALLIMIFEKSRTIGVLKALGASNRSVRRIFLLKGARLIGWGILIGDAISLVLSLVQQRWQVVQLDPENYSMTHVPVVIDPMNYLAVSLGALVVCLLALLLPLAGISRISPAQTMRVEK